jgi:hypothetical protein
LSVEPDGTQAPQQIASVTHESMCLRGGFTPLHLACLGPINQDQME